VAPDVVVDASGRSHDDLGAGVERVELVAHGGAPVDGGDPETLQPGQGRHLLRDLDGQLAGRRHDERRRLAAPGGDPLDDGDAEGGGLAGPGLRADDDVLPGQDGADGGGLHRRGADVAALGDGLTHGLGQPHVVEGDL
jgi:hypothetical protein